MEKLDYLIKYLLEENKDVKIDEIPVDQESKKKLYRSLCNIREPNPIGKEYIQIENEYLQEELKKKKVTEVEEIKPVKDRICLWKGDITTLKIGAIVNAANSQGLGCFVPCHKCIDNQIHTFAGIGLRLECNEIMREKKYHLKTSDAFLTKGYNLPSRYIIHTVGPIIDNEVSELKKKQLADCYSNSLKLAIKNGIRTIAFPCISTGEFKFPKQEASRIAIKTVKECVEKNPNYFDQIILNVFTNEDYQIYQNSFKEN